MSPQEIRESKGLTRFELSATTGLSEQGIFKIENGVYKKISRTSLKLICEALKVTPQEYRASFNEVIKGKSTPQALTVQGEN